MPKPIFALVGLCGSGKSVAAEFLEKNGYAGVYFGKLTLDELSRQGLAVTPENEKKFREEIRAKHGMGAYAQLSLPKIRELLKSGDKVYLDGLYSWDEYKILRSEFPRRLFLVAL